ncbi:PepSY-associated TM helix domain-containing protein [Eilatimonas milleporae]|uniref:Putative iron-regulated membrane protein n=1 Tax=Eilatimonas milleporae TaxID=911205 RepID=A0A3M0CMK0_9PROT|nr:PepSY-associated TM helix domain-containing protein [Eilatimonas milleporae]RMB08176.1 putative iron-regulated membrane protein [Eilatimonas milleporae]
MTEPTPQEPMQKPIQKSGRHRSIWPKVPARFVSGVLAGHSVLGLSFAALIYVICLSGTILVMAHEIERWEYPAGPLVNTATPDQIDAALANGYAYARENDKLHDIFIETPRPDAPRLRVRILDSERGIDETWLARQDGTLMERHDSTVFRFLADLHIFLHMPRTIGLFIVGLIGVTLLSSILSGVLAHPRIFRDAFSLRWGGSRRLQEADLHNRLSVWGLPFHIAVSLTGALLGLSTLILGVLAYAAFDGDMEKARGTVAGPAIAEDDTPAPPLRVGPTLHRLLAEHPQGRLLRVRVGHMATKGQAFEVQLTAPGHLTSSERYYFDGAGNDLGMAGYADGTPGQQIIGALGPLHFGWFGGLPVKLAYVLLGAALTVVTCSGVTIWIARRRDRGKPVPGWHRAWIAAVWGQPVALGVTAAGLIAVPDFPPLIPYLTTVLAAFAAARLIRRTAPLSRALRLAGAAALGGAAFIHMGHWAGQIADPMGWAGNAVLLTLAGALAASTLAGGRSMAAGRTSPAAAE